MRCGQTNEEERGTLEQEVPLEQFILEGVPGVQCVQLWCLMLGFRSQAADAFALAQVMNRSQQQLDRAEPCSRPA